jgi:hypothetical protein
MSRLYEGANDHSPSRRESVHATVVAGTSVAKRYQAGSEIPTQKTPEGEYICPAFNRKCHENKRLYILIIFN